MCRYTIIPNRCASKAVVVQNGKKTSLGTDDMGLSRRDITCYCGRECPPPRGSTRTTRGSNSALWGLKLFSFLPCRPKSLTPKSLCMVRAGDVGFFLGGVIFVRKVPLWCLPKGSFSVCFLHHYGRTSVYEGKSDRSKIPTDDIFIVKQKFTLGIFSCSRGPENGLKVEK